MDPKDAAMYLKKCIDSGLWVENANAAGAEGEEETTEGSGDVVESIDDDEEAKEKPSPVKPSDSAKKCSA